MAISRVRGGESDLEDFLSDSYLPSSYYVYVDVSEYARRLLQADRSDFRDEALIGEVVSEMADYVIEAIGSEPEKSKVLLAMAGSYTWDAKSVVYDWTGLEEWAGFFRPLSRHLEVEFDLYGSRQFAANEAEC